MMNTRTVRVSVCVLLFIRYCIYVKTDFAHFRMSCFKNVCHIISTQKRNESRQCRYTKFTQHFHCNEHKNDVLGYSVRLTTTTSNRMTTCPTSLPLSFSASRLISRHAKHRTLHQWMWMRMKMRTRTGEWVRVCLTKCARNWMLG